jgi:hypothetical protein
MNTQTNKGVPSQWVGGGGGCCASLLNSDLKCSKDLWFNHSRIRARSKRVCHDRHKRNESWIEERDVSGRELGGT